MRPALSRGRGFTIDRRVPLARMPTRTMTECELAAAWALLPVRRDSNDGASRVTVLRAFKLSSGA
jgi:hypothetical protein